MHTINPVLNLPFERGENPFLKGLFLFIRIFANYKIKVGIGDAKNLYEYWGELLYRSVIDDSRIIINLASKEYSKCIEKYLTSQDRYITIVFCELSGDKLVTKGTYAKMARGEMVRFIAENNIENPVEIQKFDRLGYSFRSDLSSDSEYVFERKIK